MNIEEIVKRDSGAIFDIEELIFVVESYIWAKKGGVIKINLMRGLPKLFMRAQLPRQVKLLNLAFNKAQVYYLKSFS